MVAAVIRWLVRPGALVSWLAVASLAALPRPPAPESPRTPVRIVAEQAQNQRKRASEPLYGPTGEKTRLTSYGLVAPSYALGEAMADYRRSQGYEIPRSRVYLAVNDCEHIGSFARLDFRGGGWLVGVVIDCAHPDDWAYRTQAGLIADAPVEWLEVATGQPNWAVGMLSVEE